MFDVDLATRRFRVAVVTGLPFEIKHHNCDAEQRLENSLQKIQGETGNVEPVSLLDLRKLLQKRLRILRRHQLVEIMALRCPLRAERNRQHKCCPD